MPVLEGFSMSLPAPPHLAPRRLEWSNVASDLTLDPDADAGPAIESMLANLGDADELLSRIDQLERELRLLQQRDQLLSRHMTKMDEEHRLAARVQHDFLPKSLPAVGPFRFHALFRPAHYVSGDLYDVKRLDEQHVGMYLADAVGHGVPAALLTMFMKNALQTKRIFNGGYELLNPTETIAQLNAALRSAELNHASFATAIYARVNCETREVRFARGGHPNPVVLHEDGSIDEPSADGALLGVFDDMNWAEGHVTLRPGDRLFLYSDGVEVAHGCGQQPDPDRWKQVLRDQRRRSTGEILQTFASALDQRAGESLPNDDLTILVAEAA